METLKIPNDEDEINKEDEHIHDEWADASGESEEVLNESLDDILLLSPGRDSIPEYNHKIHRSDIAKPKFGLGMTKEDDPWFRAKKIELTAMDEHQVWDVVDYSPGMKPITCKWVLSDKFDAQGHFDNPMFHYESVRPSTPENTLSFAHVSGKALHQLIWSAGFYWESLRSDCETEYQKCKMHGVLAKLGIICPHDHIGIDLFFMPMDVYGCIGCLVYVDYATRFTLVRRLKCQTARAIVRKIGKILRDFGLPKIIQSDRGREFVNKIMRQLCVTLGIDRRVSTAYHAHCEGTAESHVKKVKHHLKRLVGNEGSRWSDFVPAAQLAVNTTVNRRHKSSHCYHYSSTDRFLRLLSSREQT